MNDYNVDLSERIIMAAREVFARYRGNGKLIPIDNLTNLVLMYADTTPQTYKQDYAAVKNYCLSNTKAFNITRAGIMGVYVRIP